jgi:hypothetical protein
MAGRQPILWGRSERRKGFRGEAWWGIIQPRITVHRALHDTPIAGAREHERVRYFLA